MDLSALPARAAGRAAAVLPALEQAARRTGTSFEALFHTARLESGFDPSAKARTSSATGLFQFLDSTWLSVLGRHGKAHGLDAKDRTQALELRKNPLAAALMAAEHMADNGRALAGALGRPAGLVDLYLAHFLGPEGAIRFLKGLAEAPETSAASLFPRAAGANRAIFYAAGLPRSLADVHALFARRLGAASSENPAAGPKPAIDPPDAGGAGSTRSPAARPGVAATPAGPVPGRDVAPDLSPEAAARAARLLIALLGAA